MTPENRIQPNAFSRVRGENTPSIEGKGGLDPLTKKKTALDGGLYRFMI